MLLPGLFTLVGYEACWLRRGLFPGIVVTALLWCAPLLLAPPGLFRALGFPTPRPMIFVHLLGAAYRGSPKGMRGGAILVEGAAGNEVGCVMRRGLIAVGAAGDFAGVMMLAGSIFVLGRLGIRPGAGMKRGTLVTVARDGDGPRLLPTFRFDCEYRPPWLPLYARRLRALGFAMPDGLAGTACRRYSGDFTELGKGEILVWTSV